MQQTYRIILLSLLVCMAFSEEEKFQLMEGIPGFNWGMGVEECKLKLKENGKDISAAICLRDNEFLLVSGTDFTLKFTGNILTGVIYGDVFDWTIGSMIDGGKIKMGNGEISDGIRMGMSFQKVNELLDGKMGDVPDYSTAVEINGVTIEMKFSSSEMNGNKEYNLVWFSAYAKIAHGTPKIDVIKEIGK